MGEHALKSCKKIRAIKKLSSTVSVSSRCVPYILSVIVAEHFPFNGQVPLVFAALHFHIALKQKKKMPQLQSCFLSLKSSLKISLL
jgi:hypothetical protein